MGDTVTTDPELTSASLLDRARADDPEAWRRLLHIYSPLIFAWGRRAGLGSEDAADLMQEVFRAVASNLGRFRRDRAGDTFRGWLWTIARNKTRDFGRRNRGRVDAVGGSEALARLLDLPDEEPAPDDASEAAGASVVRRALELIRGDFEETSFKAFWKIAVEGVSPADAAKAVGLSVYAVYQAKYRIVRRLKLELRELVD